MAVTRLRSANRRFVLRGLAAAAAMPVAAHAAPAEAPVTFLVLGDWGRRGDADQRAVAKAMAAVAGTTSSRFVLTVGDNFYESGTRSVDDAHWRESFEAVYTAPSLQTPWYAVLGNHDHGGSPQSQVDYSAHSERWRMPAPYYRVAGSAHGAPDLELFCLDTTALVAGFARGAAAGHQAAAETQRAWLDSALGQSNARWKLIVGHHTIYSGGSAHGDTAQMVSAIQPLLEAHRVQAYLCGHDHDLQHIRRGQTDYIVCGAGADVRPTRKVAGSLFAEARLGFASMTMLKDGLSVDFRDVRGKSLYNAPIGQAQTVA